MQTTYDTHDLGRVPSLLSMLRVPLAAVFPLTHDRPALGLVVLALAGGTDVLDGWYARRHHEESTAGAVLDAVVDKVFVLSVVVTLLTWGRLSVLDVLLLGTRDLGELPLVARVALRGAVPAPAADRTSNALGKLATAMQFATVALCVLGAPQLGGWLVASALTGAAAAVSYWTREARQGVHRSANRA
jgi:CDP-diacylglycerol--glycerol-3-phosphate 3-phosphatidyltransferase/cardiolipin synthase